ncbi:MAG: hypothetical protein PHE29_13915, partial [Tissierellia bacterium]|nr:hypothetical protein [Tissierellia bacterium]
YNENAEGWFYLYNYNNIPGKIIFTFFNSESYTFFKNSISKTNFKSIVSDVLKDEIISKYENSNYILEVSVSKTQEEEYNLSTSYNRYKVTLIKKNGFFDELNGLKKEYYQDGSINAIFTLKNGNINGQLKTFYPSGQLKLVGFYNNGIKDGRFIEYNEDGSINEEYFMKNNEFNSLYRKYEKNKIIQIANFKNGILSGDYFEYHYDDDNVLITKIEGFYKEGLSHDKWHTYAVYDGKEEVIGYVSYINGVKQGKFKEYVDSDTLIIGNYKDGLFDGQYIKKALVKMTKTENDEKIQSWFIDSEGFYKNGVKDSKWTYYFLGNKYEEGHYINGNKEGKWITYVFIGKHKGEILSETTYLNGKKNGLSTSYYELESITLDTGFKIISTPRKEYLFYKNGIKEGNYCLEDSLGNIKVTGFYTNGEMDSTWKFIYDDSSIIEEYNKGILVTAKYYNELDELYLKETYKNNEIFICEYFDDGIIEEEHTIKKYKNKYSVRVLSHSSDTTFISNYIVDSDKEYTYNVFKEYGYKDGIITATINNNLIFEGKYCNNKKCNTWIFIYNDYNAYARKEFSDDKVLEEFFYNLNDKKPFNGTITFNSSHGRIVSKVKKGQRHGKTKYYNLNNHIVMIEKYKKGILIK